MAETLASQGRQRPRRLVQPFGVGTMVVVRLPLAVNTLLGPEGTSTPHVLGLFVSSGQTHVSRDTGPPCGGCGSCGWTVWGLVVV